MTEPFLAQQPSRLDTLPTEIIQRIAFRGSFESTMSLLQVSRVLYKTCNDWTVFQRIVENSLHHFGSRSKWNLISIAHRDTSVWSRYAYANSKAVQFMASRDDFIAPGLNQWLPHLIALRHPILSALSLRQLSKIIMWFKSEDTLGLRFCLTASTTVVDTSREFDYNTKIEFYSDFMAEDLGEFSFRDLEELDMNLVMFPFIATSHGVPDCHDPGSPTALLLQITYRSLPVICFELISRLKQARGNNTGLPVSTQVSRPVAFPLPPTALTIPFPSLMDVPLPFSLGCAEMFATSHLRVMTTAAFIESGEWTGYLCAQIERPLHDMSRPRFDRPIEGIKFSVVRKSEEPGVSALKSRMLTGRYGKFYFEGELWTTSGKINLRKRDEGSPSALCLRALMTPFGIVANWGVAKGHWMWLWKSEWSAGSVEW